MSSQRLLPEAHSYATFANAELYIKKEITRFEEMYELVTRPVDTNVRYLILAQANGRFSVVVQVGDKPEQFDFFLHGTKAAVIN